MSKKEAITLMLEGVYVTHDNLIGESITYRGAEVLFSNSKPSKIRAFWKVRMDSSWNHGWTKS